MSATPSTSEPDIENSLSATTMLQDGAHKFYLIYPQNLPELDRMVVRLNAPDELPTQWYYVPRIYTMIWILVCGSWFISLCYTLSLARALGFQVEETPVSTLLWVSIPLMLARYFRKFPKMNVDGVWQSSVFEMCLYAILSMGCFMVYLYALTATMTLETTTDARLNAFAVLTAVAVIVPVRFYFPEKVQYALDLFDCVPVIVAKRLLMAGMDTDATKDSTGVTIGYYVLLAVVHLTLFYDEPKRVY